MKQHTWIIIIVAVVALLGGSFWLANQASQAANEGITFKPHLKGNPEAEVVLVKYSDFQCPACAQAAPVVRQILEQYGDQVRFEYKHFPLLSVHPLAVPAARAAEAAGQQDKFWEMHDKLFENQTAWSKAGNPNAHFEQYAKEIGLDMELYRRHLDASLISDKISEEFAEARAKGFSSTPTFTLNGEQIKFQTYQELIDQVATAVGSPATVEDVEFGI